MRNSGSYQLVSKYSILSAQRDNRVAAMEEFLEKQTHHSKTEWKAELDKIKQRLERRRQRCDELSEKEFEIYLEMKLQWLQEYYVTAKSRKPEMKTKEAEQEGWNESIEEDLKFWKLEAFAKSKKSEEIRATAISEKEPEEDEWNEDVKEELKFQKLDVSVKSGKPEEKGETVELNKEKNEIEGSSGVPWDVDAKPEEETTPKKPNGDSISESVSIITKSEEKVLEASPLEASEEEWTTSDSGKQLFSLAREEYDLEKWNAQEVERDGGDQSPPSEGSSLEEEDGGATMEAVEIVRDARKQSLSIVTEYCDVFGRESGTSTEEFLEEVGLLVDPRGQAQYLICTPPQFTNREWVLQEVKGRGPERKTKTVWELEELDLTYNSVGQAQVQVSKCGNSYMNRGVLGVIREMKNINPHLCTFLDEAFPCVWECKNTNISSQTAAILTWDQLVNISPLSSLINVEEVGRAFDSGGNLSVSSITWSSCFKLWDPGGRLIIVVFQYLHLEDKVNV